MMITADQVEVHEQGTAAATRSDAARPLRYLVIVLVSSITFMIAAIPVARTEFFEQVSRRMFWHSMEYHSEMGGQNCPVVVFGDSTGMTGIDPLIVEKRTGLKTCVLSLPYMALSTTGTKILDNYLAHNRAPRLILFANHGRHLKAPALDEEPGIVDGWLLVDRLDSPLTAARFYLEHPKFSMIFIENVWQQVFGLSPSQQLDLTKRTYRRDMAILREHNGFFPLEVTETPERVCSIQETAPVRDFGYLPELRKRYETSQTKVFFYASPARSCDHNLLAFRQLASLLGIAPPDIYPPEEFSDAWHLNAKGAAINSEHVASIVAALLHAPDGNQKVRTGSTEISSYPASR